MDSLLVVLPNAIFSILTISIGIALVLWTLYSAIQTFILPRSAPNAQTRFWFRKVRLIFNWLIRDESDFKRIDSVMALYAPITLVSMPFFWLFIIMNGYTLILWGAGAHPPGVDLFSLEGLFHAYRMSGSSLLTLGFVTAETPLHTVIAFTEAALGPTMIALLIAYLPTLYAAFSKREALVAMLEVRAGSPFTTTELFRRVFRFAGVDELHSLWRQWEVWFTELEETHTSLPMLVFFRSQQPTRSWITAAGLIMDATALQLSAMNLPNNGYAPLTLRAGFIALRRISDFFGIQYDPDPKPTDPISVTRREFDQVYDELAELKLFPMKPDRDQAWRDYAGWRVNYDTVLIALATIVIAPPAAWSSDRGIRGGRPILFETAAESAKDEREKAERQVPERQEEIY